MRYQMLLLAVSLNACAVFAVATETNTRVLQQTDFPRPKFGLTGLAKEGAAQFGETIYKAQPALFISTPSEKSVTLNSTSRGVQLTK